MLKEEKLLYFHKWLKENITTLDTAKQMIIAWDRGVITMPYFHNCSREAMAYQLGMALDGKVPEKINGDYTMTTHGRSLYWQIG